MIDVTDVNLKENDKANTLIINPTKTNTPILEIEELEDSQYHQEKNTFETFLTPNGEKLSTIKLPFSTK